MNVDITSRDALSPTDVDDMYALFAAYYDNTDHERFERDLANKQWIIRIRSADDELAGFSSVEIFRHATPDVTTTIIYSGDTIVARSHRRGGALAGAFGHVLMRTMREHTDSPLYWLLTSKGVRTYRFLPVFFETFYPAFNRTIPADMQALLDGVAAKKFGAAYSPSDRIVRHQGRRDRLCAAEDDAAIKARSDPHSRFFFAANPGYADGNELACIAAIHAANLNARAVRVIDQTEVMWRE